MGKRVCLASYIPAYLPFHVYCGATYFTEKLEDSTQDWLPFLSDDRGKYKCCGKR